MSDPTPRTDAHIFDGGGMEAVPAKIAKDLERELAVASKVLELTRGALGLTDPQDDVVDAVRTCMHWRKRWCDEATAAGEQNHATWLKNKDLAACAVTTHAAAKELFQAVNQYNSAIRDTMDASDAAVANASLDPLPPELRLRSRTADARLLSAMQSMEALLAKNPNPVGSTQRNVGQSLADPEPVGLGPIELKAMLRADAGPQPETTLTTASCPSQCNASFKCCGAGDPPCRNFEESCQNPANYGDGDGFCPKCKRPGFVFCATSGCPLFIQHPPKEI